MEELQFAFDKNKWILVEFNVDLMKTLYSGQVFNFIRTKNDEYCGFVGDDLLILRQKQKYFEFLDLTENTKKAVYNFFNLDITMDFDFYQQPGLRFLTNDFISTTFSFICSQNNNVKRITKMVSFLYSKGDYVRYEDCNIYKFINPRSFMELIDIDKFTNEMNLNGFGYRSKYIVDALKAFCTNDNLSEEYMRSIGYEDARNNLLRIKGIGKKVADCICLMSLKYFHVVPIDTHILKFSIKQFKIKDLNNKKYEIIQEKWKEVYGKYAGIAQLHIFKAYLDKTIK